MFVYADASLNMSCLRVSMIRIDYLSVREMLISLWVTKKKYLRVRGRDHEEYDQKNCRIN